MQKIVIDAGVWNHWYNVPPDELSSYSVIENYLNNDNDEALCFDFDGVIMNQCGKNTDGDFYRVIKNCYDRIFMLESAIEDGIKSKLKDELGFHEDSDLCYVGVALHADKIILTLDGDYGIFPSEHYRSSKDASAKHAVADYMKDNLALKVYTPEDYLKQ